MTDMHRALPGHAGVEEPLALCTLPKHLFSATPEDLRAVRSLRVGVYSSWLEAADPEVVAGCKNAIVHLEKLGAEVRVSTLKSAITGAVVVFFSLPPPQQIAGVGSIVHNVDSPLHLQAGGGTHALHNCAFTPSCLHVCLTPSCRHTDCVCGISGSRCKRKPLGCRLWR